MIGCRVFFTLLLLAGCIVEASTNSIPKFKSGFDDAKIDENMPIGTHVKTVTARDKEGDSIKYSLIGDTNGYFAIDAITGELTTARIIDREKLDNNYAIEFKIAATEVKRKEAQATQDFIVYISDMNEYPPIFKKNVSKVQISESLAGDKFVTSVEANDIDATPDPEILYSIVSGNKDNSFRIENRNGVGLIRVEGKLDFEKTPIFKLVIEAADGRKNDKHKLSSLGYVIIQLLDEDDNGAAFQSNYTATITEGKKKGVLIKQVKAEDQDREINADVEYSIESSSNFGGLFSIDSQNGKVYVNGDIDRETKGVYHLVLLANEIGKGRSSPDHPPGRTTLTVTVEDVNDNSPEFTESTFSGKVLEHENIGEKILTAKAIDKDKGPNAMFEYLLEGDESKMFGINQSGDIFVKEDLDRETKYLYEFEVVARQIGRRDSKAKVTITVEDKNDQSPKFIKDVYEQTIEENLDPGVFVAQVSAIDRDHGDNAKIQYKIRKDGDGIHGHFGIDPDTGKIVTTTKLDYEKRSRYEIVVEASNIMKDDTKNKLTDTTKVKIEVKDRNDNKPVFKETRITKHVHYDAAINTQIVQLEAIDADSAAFGKVSYRIIKGNEENRFHIESLTGQLKVGDALAAYSGPFVLVIEAYDNLGNKPSNICNGSAIVQVAIVLGENSVVLTMQKRVADVLPHQEKIISALKKILGIGVVKDNIEIGEQSDSTNFIFHGYNENTEAVVKKEQVMKTLKTTTSEEMVKFRMQWNITRLFELAKITKLEDNAKKEEEKNSDKWHPIIYAVLGFSALIAIFGMIGIVYLIKSKRRNEFDSGASQASSRIPITARKSRNFWNDDAFESVSQGVPDSYVHSSGFLDRSCDRYELDPSNMYGSQDPYRSDPFNQVDSSPSHSSTGSRASSIFAASSVMTVVTAINNRQGAHNKRSRTHTQQSMVSPRERKLSVILDDEGKTRTILDDDSPIQSQRPPSYEYDLDEKLIDNYECDA